MQVSDSSAGTCFQCLSYGVVYVVQCQRVKHLASKCYYFGKIAGSDGGLTLGDFQVRNHEDFRLIHAITLPKVHANWFFN